MEGNRLEVITIEGLFGARNLQLWTSESGTTVLTGSNGTGKSTILRLLYAVSARDMVTLINAPIESMSLGFSHIPSFSMSRDESQDGKWLFQWGEHRDYVGSHIEIEDLPSWAIEALRDYDFDTSLTTEHLTEYILGSTTPVEYRAARELIQSLDNHSFRASAPDWMEAFQDLFPAVFVTDQRLVVEANRKNLRNASVVGSVGARSGRRASTTTRAVEAASNELARQIALADSNYARNSQLVDRRFPAEIISAMQFDRGTSIEAVERLVEAVDTEREKLRLVGLLDTDTEYQPELGAGELALEHVRVVVGAILRSTLKKFEVLRDLSTRLTALKVFLDNRFESKTLSLSRNSGLAVILDNGKVLRPSQLSSGEQQMIVLAFEILFNTRPETLVIIDEPEISLHVLWQDTLIQDLSAMGEPSRLQFMMATHSPAILGDHPHLERSLDGLLT